ncbi:sporulation protein YunB [Paenibacillus oenotherae]|uniref:Sporulation protein YunB n=1 Tax=Paenibacillus oenotherae TaxID=1435645 RepID=A0ABS7DAK7_9BACL|nr:sporulation protein YunB [Paenibacillus oenotherae]MBW7476532.1 sporulation protein YunB [Paenibacillus oenotherae]
MAKWGRRGWRSSRGRGGRRRSRTGKLSRRKFLLIIVLIMFLFMMQSFIYIERNLRGPLMHVAQIRIKQVATQAINKAISEQVAHQSNFDKLVDWKTSSSGKVSGFMLNYAEHMRITSQTIETVQSMLDRIGDIPEHIPIGQAMGSAFIASYGPRIPVKFEPLGAVKVDLNTRQRDAGINMILVEVYMRIVAEVSIIIPFDTKPELVDTEIPISYLLVVGDVPMYYYDNNGKPVGDSAPGAPSISLPMGTGRSIDSPMQDDNESVNPNESLLEREQTKEEENNPDE